MNLYKVMAHEDEVGGLTLFIYRVKKHIATIEVDALDRMTVHKGLENYANVTVKETKQ